MLRCRLLFGVVWLVVLAAATPVRASEDRENAPVDFAREILPLLSNKCFVCHGPDGEAKDELRLDSFAAATREQDGHRAIDPEAPQKSEILTRIHSADDPMPPADAEKQLTPKELALLEPLGAPGRQVRHALGVCAAAEDAAARQ